VHELSSAKKGFALGCVLGFETNVCPSMGPVLHMQDPLAFRAVLATHDGIGTDGKRRAGEDAKATISGELYRCLSNGCLPHDGDTGTGEVIVPNGPTVHRAYRKSRMVAIRSQPLGEHAPRTFFELDLFGVDRRDLGEKAFNRFRDRDQAAGVSAAILTCIVA
jgi:hypothetical protein